MTDYEIHDTILDQACKEIAMFAEKIKSGKGVSLQDYETLDTLYHLKKDMLACKSMEDAEGYEEGMSGRRGRAPNGQYMSRETSRGRMSYDEGYSRGYSDAQSGHWPMPPYRNW